MASIPTFSSLPDKPAVTPPAHLAHVVLQTAQLRVMQTFYEIFLGAHTVYSNDHLAFLTYDQEHHRIALAALPGIVPRSEKSSGLNHIAFTFPSLTSLLTAYQQRKKHGMQPTLCVNHGPTTSIYYRDPDGNTIETQVDGFEEPADATAFMESEAFAKNPLGVEFVPEVWMEKLGEGVDERSLMVRDEDDAAGALDIERLVEKLKGGKVNGK
ncbi:glyoxalase bleomycin resistance protein dioxygenase [Lindgomyces ingoldianus]|uniref:Glyoxalase bleomycin resistance protein dioxygenase n=1 Tax=Lindgomyces ingoldianus TaxID=673940 RepID=A0ACB6Q892_9PLEO|nr:glyoxalase bleomycin resistance protein dioxygenase [Lindgomyces ingoldianus]KAF2463091.1 glyoxalase bleomycin resistance protein dioxygenase [Lindgomyces ingoldianus]